MPQLDKEKLIEDFATKGYLRAFEELYAGSDDPAGVAKEVNRILGLDVRTEPWEVFSMNWPDKEDPEGTYIVAPNWESNPFRYANYENVIGKRAPLSRRDMLSQEQGTDQGVWRFARGRQMADKIAASTVSPTTLAIESVRALGDKTRSGGALMDAIRARNIAQYPPAPQMPPDKAPAPSLLANKGVQDFIMRLAISELFPAEQTRQPIPRPDTAPNAYRLYTAAQPPM